MELEPQKYGQMGTWRHGGHRDIKRKMENGSPGDFPFSFNRLLIMQTEVCPFVDEEKRNLTVCKRTKQTKRTYPSIRLCRSGGQKPS